MARQKAKTQYDGPVRVLLIDNYDSFTFNLYQQLGSLGAKVTVVKNDAISAKEAFARKPTHIVLSPGPGRPEKAGVCNGILETYKWTVGSGQWVEKKLPPLLGVCLGHQCLGTVFSSVGPKNVIHAPELLHGKTSVIRHTGEDVMKGMPATFAAARYHSLMVKELPPEFRLMCWAAHRGKRLIMGMAHERLPLYGVQFHPESFLTPHGDRLMRNFLTMKE